MVSYPVNVKQVPEDNLGHEQLQQVVSNRVLLAVVVHVYLCAIFIVLKRSVADIVCILNNQKHDYVYH